MNRVLGADISFYQDDPDTPQGVNFRKMKEGAEFVIINFDGVQIVKDEIAQQVATSVRGAIAEDVVKTAKSEGWGVPGALPDWLHEVTAGGDVRVGGGTASSSTPGKGAGTSAFSRTGPRARICAASHRS